MQQVYHSNAATNLNIRSQIQNNLGTNSDLATRFNVSEQTISKWKNRDFTQDASCKPLNIEYALSDLEKALAISLRKSSWMSIDEVWETLLIENSKISRSSIYRVLVKEKINVFLLKRKKKLRNLRNMNLDIYTSMLPIYQSLMGNLTIFSLLLTGVLGQ